tara:strand:- start:48 stop:248 length:201 start_codon:yes stop_codon:yes gene_type:complete
MRNIISLALDVLEKELLNELSKNKVNIAIKILNNYKLSTLIVQKIGSENPDTIKKIQSEKIFEEIF